MGLPFVALGLPFVGHLDRRQVQHEACMRTVKGPKERRKGVHTTTLYIVRTYVTVHAACMRALAQQNTQVES